MLLQLKDITKTYERGIEEVRALRGADLEIDENEYVAIMGPPASPP
jgi:ABC-type lipoprotein export system ATPase subunit